MNIARELWQKIEAFHAVTYFAPESRAAAADAGLLGFWMAYFGFRAAPLGAVDAPVVVDAFNNFSPAMVDRAIPDAWRLVTPAELVDHRSRSAAAALRRLSPTIEMAAATINPLLQRIVDSSPLGGLALFAANAALPTNPDSVAWCWQLCTSLREQRGDGHIRALRAVAVDGCESHVLHAAQHDTPVELLRDNRGWTHADWTAAARRLGERGLLADTLTAAGIELRAGIEAETDRHALVPIDAALGVDEQQQLIGLLTGPVAEVTRSGIIPFPNPMGLPRPVP